MPDTIKFLLNGEEREIKNVSPTLTVLEYIRTQEHLTGTKEGCAEGDCGACTVVLADIKDGKLIYRAVNSCIVFLPKLHGKLLITVEGVKKDGKLHPVQQEMLDMHGSQCGFCTPGFIMALVAYYHANVTGKEDTDTIHELLAGNLCRCTGYRPIIEAAHAIGGKKKDWYSDNEAELVAKLEKIKAEGTPSLTFENKRYFSPQSIAELGQVMAKNPKAYLFAGGTDLGLLVTKANRELETIVHVGDVPEINKVEEAEDCLEIGAAVPYVDALPIIEKYFADFGKLIRRIGSTQIRNLGTMGGNIANASPIGDSAPCLLALEAVLVLASSKGTREVELKDFFTGYRQTQLKDGEFIAAIRIPKLKNNEFFKAYKVTKRFDQDISATCGAFKFALDGEKIIDAKIGFGGMAATPMRAVKSEAALIGKIWNEETAENAAKVVEAEFSPLSDFRASAEYRRQVAHNLFTRLYAQTGKKAKITEIWDL